MAGELEGRERKWKGGLGGSWAGLVEGVDGWLCVLGWVGGCMLVEESPQ